MNNKEFYKYFKPKNNVPLYIGVGIVVFAVLVAALYWLPLGVCFGFIGVAVVCFGRDSRPSDSEIDNAVAGRIADLDEQIRMRLGKREKLIGAYSPMVFRSFVFDGGELLAAKGRDGAYRSNRYSAAELILAKDRLHVMTHTLSLTDDGENVGYAAVSYADIECAKIVRENVSFALYGGVDKTERKECCRLTVTDRAGNTVVDIPAEGGADLEAAVDAIERLSNPMRAA